MADAPSREGLKAAQETTKQILTLATGIATLTVTFAKEFKPADESLHVPLTLEVAWFFFAVSVLFGLWTLLAIVGAHNQLDQRNGSADAMASNIRVPALLMIVAFAVAFVLTLVAGGSVVR
jgi:hypothetical protein